MFWRFGFHNASNIDSLLDKNDAALEDILDEDDLLQECKAQNTRLIDYFQRLDVLHRLFGYVSGEIEHEKGRLRYPYIATEVLCSEIWSIVEACLNNTQELLIPFWDVVLDRSSDEMQTTPALPAHFAKIIGVFMTKKPAEMLAFIKSQNNVVGRLVKHIVTPAIADLIIRIIQLDELPGNYGVSEWLSSENLIERLVDFLSPSQHPEVHATASELIKTIIAMSAPAPGGTPLNDGLQQAQASNQFARELASPAIISKLIRFMLDSSPGIASQVSHDNGSMDTGCSTSLPRFDSPSSSSITPSSSFTSDLGSSSPEVDVTWATSSLTHSISVIIELIRRNNSDYFEPYLFHHLRSHLMHVQQQVHGPSDNGRRTLEQAMTEMASRITVVHLGFLLDLIGKRIPDFQALLQQPRSEPGEILTSIGSIKPLTTERFRICELYAELLHCSNMSLLNRNPGTGPTYDAGGRIKGGLSALEELASVIASGNGESHGDEENTEDAVEMGEAKDFPVHKTIVRSTESSSAPSDSDDNVSENSLDGLMEDKSDLPVRHSPSLGTRSPPNGHTFSNPQIAESPHLSQDGVGSPGSLPSASSGEPTVKLDLDSRRGSADSDMFPIGDVLKQQFIDLEVPTKLLDLFFEFPWNNFLHGTVYDFVHQVLTGRVDEGKNRTLIVALFRDARLLYRIVDAYKENEIYSHSKHMRLGFMGHLTLIAEDVITVLDHYPEDLCSELRQYAPEPSWNEYVSGGYHETKQRDSQLLGGGRPVVVSSNNTRGRWGKVDEEDTGASSSLFKEASKSAGGSGITSEFRRNIGSSSTVPINTAHFGPSQEEEEAVDHPQFARYLAEEIHANPISGFPTSASSSDTSDEEDDDGGWLSRSNFDVDTSTHTAHANDASTSALHDAFLPAASFLPAAGSSRLGFDDAFDGAEEDDDGFGPFSDSTGAVDSLTFSDVDESPFDFGDFASAQADEIGGLTSTAGSWTFEGDGEQSMTDAVDLPRQHERGFESDFGDDFGQGLGVRRDTHAREPSIGQ